MKISLVVMKIQYIDPLAFVHWLWPHYYLYEKQREVMYSVRDNVETVVPAGNQLGKDFVSGLIILWYFLSRDPCRIVTTSVKDDHLIVLWDEINRFIQEAAVPLDASRGGPLLVKHREIRKFLNGTVQKTSYIKGMVSARGEGLQGHHVDPSFGPRTLFVGDESSGLEDICHTMSSTWAHRKLLIGNPWECENFFKHAVKGRPGTNDRGGDIPHSNRPGYIRKVIKICAEDSPNVKMGIAQIFSGKRPPEPILIRTEDQPWGVYTKAEYDVLKADWDAYTLEEKERLIGELKPVMGGVKDFDKYVLDRTVLDKIKQSVVLDGEFYEGAEVKLYPAAWIDRAERLAEALKKSGKKRVGKYIGCDPAEGGDSSAWTVIDEYGILEQIVYKTPDTTDVAKYTMMLMKKHNISPENVLIDAGGGGHVHANYMRRDHGLKIRTIAFGESASSTNRFRRMRTSKEKEAEKETRYVYKNRRAEMYGTLREVLDPTEEGFAIPRELVAMRQQMSPIRLDYDREGRLYLPPKNKQDPNSNEECLRDLLGCSPDELDSCVLAVFGMTHKHSKSIAGAF